MTAQEYKLNCHKCGRVFISSVAFPELQLCPECRGVKMTAQDKLVEVICEACLPYICAHWDKPSKERMGSCKPLKEWVDRIHAIIPDLAKEAGYIKPHKIKSDVRPDLVL